VAIALGLVGLASTAITIFLSAVPANDEPNKMLAIVKVVGGTAAMLGSGAAVFAFSRWKTQRNNRRSSMDI
jgi:hypothetical protein